MRRRARGTPPPKPFDQAFAGIDRLEQNVMARVRDVHFSAEDVVRWLFPGDVVDKLQAAFPFVRDVDRGMSITEQVLLPLTFPTVSCTFSIRAKGAQSVNMLVPQKGVVQPDENKSGTFLPAIRTLFEHHEQFEKVRKVARWLNIYATVGAARHYCPWLTSVLPPDHPFQSAGGTIFREPGNTAAIMDTMRECGVIMASALLCGEPPETDTGAVSVQFSGTRDFLSDRTGYTSNPFDLV